MSEKIDITGAATRALLDHFYEGLDKEIMKNMKQQFKVGDRVRVYDGGRVRSATIIERGHLGFPGSVDVEYDDTDHEDNIQRDLVHYKQCRRLVRKQRKELTEEILYEAWKAFFSGVNLSFAQFKKELEQRLGREIRSE